MNKILAIIAEYNPFHNGHLYHLQQSQKQTNCDYTIAIISGNFTQRGNTSLIDKWAKTQIAIQNGIDLVIELPTLYAISSAENFADGCIKILNSLNVVNYLSFGAEHNNIDTLNEIADVLYTEPASFKHFLSQELSKGLSYPKSRENALISFFKNNEKYKNILCKPNNILGIEYLKALKKHKSNIKPIAIPRYIANYNDTVYKNNIASSTAIRNLIKNNNIACLKKIIPESSYNILINYFSSR